jgi:hypothetical protein
MNSQRLPYLDNLKILLVAGVIAVHVAITYGMEGSWYLASYGKVAPAARDAITALGAIGWLFGLGLFFLIAGRLSGPSLERKGAGRFVRERLLRLGLPLVAFTMLVSPLLEYVSVRADGAHPAFWPFVSSAIWGFDPGPTWFLEALLAFSAAAAIWWVVRPSTRVPGDSSALPTHRLRGREVAAVAAGIAVASFAIRFAVPLGSQQFHLQLAVFPQYALLFAFGVAAGRAGWLEAIPSHVAARCGFAALAAALAVPVVLSAGGFFSGSKGAFEGGLHWQALAVIAVEATLAPCACVYLIWVFQRHFDRQGALGRRLAHSAYGAFLLHPPVIVGLALAVHPLAIPVGLKLAMVLGVGIAGSFAIAVWATRLRPMAMVIGIAHGPQRSTPRRRRSRSGELSAERAHRPAPG